MGEHGRSRRDGDHDQAEFRRGEVPSAHEWRDDARRGDRGGGGGAQRDAHRDGDEERRDDERQPGGVEGGSERVTDAAGLEHRAEHPAGAGDEQHETDGLQRRGRHALHLLALPAAPHAEHVHRQERGEQQGGDGGVDMVRLPSLRRGPRRQVGPSVSRAARSEVSCHTPASIRLSTRRS